MLQHLSFTPETGSVGHREQDTVFQALVDALLRGGWRDGEAVCVAQDLIMKRHCTAEIYEEFHGRHAGTCRGGRGGG